LWRDGIIAGLFLFVGYALQTEGLARTSASNSGLITGLYVVFTPILASTLRRRPPQGWVVTGTGVAFVGLALLTVRNGMSVGTGDLLTVGCAAAFAVHIVILSRVATRHPVVPFTAVQLLVTALAALGIAALQGPLPVPDASTIWAVVVTGVVVSAGAFLLQVWSQTVIGPSRTAVILALEPAFAALTAFLVLGERLGLRGWTGALLILAGIYLVLARTSEPTAAAEAITPAH
jgi:drug/metabolite transporter (DMT)-like permease